MNTRHLLFAQLAALAILFVLHLAGQLFFLQWHLWWFDILLHGLGGLWIGWLTLWFVRRFNFSDTYIVIIGTGLLIGIGWELFEVLVDMPRENNYALDTVVDVTMVVLGATCGYWSAGRAISPV